MIERGFFEHDTIDEITLKIAESYYRLRLLKAGKNESAADALFERIVSAIEIFAESGSVDSKVIEEYSYQMRRHDSKRHSRDSQHNAL